MTSLEASIEACTNEKRTEDDWGTILDICEKVEKSPNGPRDCLRAVVKRLKHRVPHVNMLALTLLDALVKNCSKTFRKEMSSREFTNEVKNILNGKNTHAKVAQKFRFLIKKWADNEFKGDSELDLFVSMYQQLARDGAKFDFIENDFKNSDEERRKAMAREEEDIAKAIALSLSENDKKGRGASGGGASKATAKSSGAAGGGPTASGGGGAGGGASGLYPNSTLFGLGGPGHAPLKEPRKVRALYDFEAVEDNELTFKASEIILVSDDSDANWWRGSNHRGEGLFPATFVSADLDAKPDGMDSRGKGVSFAGEVTVVEEAAADTGPPAPVTIDEAAIDECLAMLENADPTGEMKPDPPNMEQLEARCRMMAPLIDAELERIDRRHNDLAELNVRLTEALQLYNSLMEGGLKMEPISSIPANMPPSGHLPQMPPISMPQQAPQGLVYHPYSLPPGMVPPGSGAPPMQPPPPQQPPQQPPQAPLPNPNLSNNNNNMAPPTQPPMSSEATPHLAASMPPPPSQNGTMIGASVPYMAQPHAGTFFPPNQMPPSQSPLL